ncbi:hypothetical protein [uncultured Veillonella sp.]|uniref:hypothetical protein n=1 Tax=uncultured Veillonella sp. TaxID=159268 RepID=UPI003208ACBE
MNALILTEPLKALEPFQFFVFAFENNLCGSFFRGFCIENIHKRFFSGINSDGCLKRVSLKRLTIPTESYELYRAWVKLNENSPVALVYSADDPSDCFTLTAEAVDGEIECQGEASETYEAYLLYV